jgi:hypothetical protein
MSPRIPIILTIPLILAACASGPIPGPISAARTTADWNGPSSVKVHAFKGRIRISPNQVSNQKPTTCGNSGVDLELIVPVGTTLDLEQSPATVNTSARHKGDTGDQVLRSFPVRIFNAIAGSAWRRLTSVFVPNHSVQIGKMARSRVQVHKPRPINASVHEAP